MKKTLTVNLGGTVFHIDEDAYQLLDEYLSNLRLHFRKQEGAEEIVTDIENRISELFLEVVNEGAQVITIAHVEAVIERMGKPEELAGSNDDSSNNSHSDYFGKQTGSTGPQRRLYRNPDDTILGGVCGGIAAYLGWDVTLVRLVMLVLLFFSAGTMTVIYLVCWLVIPKAETAAEKLSMRGEEVTVENIGKTVTDGFDKVSKGVNDIVNSDKPRTFFQKLADILVTVAGFILKACLILFAIVFSPVLFILAVVFVALVIAAIATVVGGGAALLSLLPTLTWMPETVAPAIVIVSCIAGTLMAGIPLAGLVYLILRMVFNWKPMSSGVQWTLVALWLVAVVVFIFTLAQMNWQFPLIYF